ncbi:DnaJ-domain-containing protein [Lactarius indigo]|nr:DnaJ-domain-containing protein [Lactarius indigo]
MASFPDYYNVLHIPKEASTEDIRQAYRKESLKTHPDRLVRASAEEKKAATEKFQAVADAYYVLSDPQRRREYDKLSASRPSSERTNDPNASSNFFSTFASMFDSSSTTGEQAGTGTGTGTAPAEQPGQRPNADRVFGDVFEDVCLTTKPSRDVRLTTHPSSSGQKVERHLPLWAWLGAACWCWSRVHHCQRARTCYGCICGKPTWSQSEMLRGKSVAAVFAELGGAQKAEILRALALKVLGAAYT